MDITVYFLKLEDKYWGLLLIAAFFLFAPGAGALGKKASKDPQKQLFTILGLYGFLSYLLFLCPLTYRAVGRFFVPESRYELVSHIWMFSLILPLAGAAAFSLAEKKKQKTVIALGLVVLFFLAGEFFPISQAKAENRTGDYKAYEQSYEAILQDAAQRGVSPVIWGPSEWMAVSRILSGDLSPVYGKDIASFAEKYPEQIRLLKAGYDSYESPDSPMDNKDDQIGALGNLLCMNPETGCNYLVIYDPQKQGLSFRADDILCPIGFVPVASSGDLLIYYYTGG